MASISNARTLVERLYKCMKGSSKADYRVFTTACIQLARMVDLAVAKHQKLSIVQELTQLLKKVCEQKDNEMFQPAMMVLLMSVKNAICFGWFTASEGQDLLRMSKELLDFFTGAGGWNAVDSNEASKFISTIMPRFYPLLSLQAVIVALEAKPGYEAMVCDFYVLKKPSTSEELCMFVIRKDNQDTSSCLVTPNHVNFLVNGKGVEKRSLTSLDMGPQMPSNVTGMLKIGTNLLQIVGDFPGSYLIAIALTTTTADFSSPLNLQIYDQAGIKVQTDEELIEGPSRVSLNCPISHKRITSPVKGSSCKHHQCFDYNSFMEINSRRPAWRCPYCNRHVCFPDLRLDLKMLKILKETQGNAMDVMVSDDGSWKTLKNEGAANGNMGVSQMCRKKDQNSPNSLGESSTEEGEICFGKNDTNYIDLSDNEEQERRDHDDACNSFAVTGIGGGRGGEMEDRKPNVRNINLAISASSTHGQIEGSQEESWVSTSAVNAAEPAVVVPHGNSNHSTTFTVQALPNEGVGYITPEGLVERQANRDISRSPIAIQALPAQTAILNPNFRTRSRTSYQPNSPAQGGAIHPVATNSSQFGVNQRPLQVQLPSFVGIQDGQVLLNTAPHQPLQQDVQEYLTTSQLQQGADLRDHRQRVVQQLQQQRTNVTQALPQPVHRVSRDHPYYPAARNINQMRTAERQGGNQQASYQQSVRPDSPNLLDNQLRQQARLLPAQVQPIQQQLQQQSQLNLGSYGSNAQREENISLGFTGVAEGVPLFNQSSGIASALRRQASLNTRTVTPQYLQAISNPSIVPNLNTAPRDQRWMNPLDGLPVQVLDTPNVLHPEQTQRPVARMRGSITNPGGWDMGANSSLGQSPTSLACLYGGSPQPVSSAGNSNQPSRFSPGISPSWSNDSLRQLDPPRASTGLGMNLQSIQTPSTLVTDFDNWLETQIDYYLFQQGPTDLGDMSPI